MPISPPTSALYIVCNWRPCTRRDPTVAAASRLVTVAFGDGTRALADRPQAREPSSLRWDLWPEICRQLRGCQTEWESQLAAGARADYVDGVRPRSASFPSSRSPELSASELSTLAAESFQRPR